jgi:putative hydrolase of the HAD superfamily
MKDRDAICDRYIRPLVPISTGIAPNLSNMQPFSALLFDVYGTLLISGAGDIGLNRQIPTKRMKDLQNLSRYYGIDRTPDDLATALTRAIEQSHAISKSQGIDYPEVDIVRIWQQVLGWEDPHVLKFFALAYELMVNPVYPMPGCEDLLLACKTRHVPMGIISNAQFYTVSLLERFFGTTLAKQGFDQRLLFYSWREGHAKPSVVMFDRAKTILLKMGIPAASVLYVGNDMRNDILPAASIGFKTALFAGDQRSLRQRESDQHCKTLTADLIVTDLRQLIAGSKDPYPRG